MGTIEPEVARAEFDRARAKPPESLDAWALYHRAIFHYVRWTRDENLRARQLFERAAELDENFARAHAGISLTYTQGALLGLSSYDREQALREAETAVRLDDQDSFSHLALGRIYYHNREHQIAVDELELALALNPSSAQAHNELGLALQAVGDPKKALVHMELSVRLSPSDPQVWGFIARQAGIHLALRNYQKSVEIARRALTMIDVWPLRSYLTASLAHLGRLDQAADEARKLKEFEPRISIAFVSEHLPVSADHLEHLLEGLRLAGISEK